MATHGIPSTFGQGGAHLAAGDGAGSPNLPDILTGLLVANGSAVATLTALAAISADNRSNGTKVMVLADGSMWRFASASTLTGDNFLVVTPSSGTGAWLRVTPIVDIKVAVAYTTANSAVLWTVPAGFVIDPGVPYWEVTTGFTGGSSSAIGLSSSNAGLNTAGDLLGGASGDVAATLVSTGALAKGTVGAKIGKPPAYLTGGDTVIFNRITSAFTAGAGFIHIPAHIVVAPAA